MSVQLTDPDPDRKAVAPTADPPWLELLRAPGAPPPPQLYELTVLDGQLQRKLGELADACRG